MQVNSSTMSADLNLCFLLHILVEIPALINFMVYPSKQLGVYTPHAHAIIRQYALLLLCSVLIAWLFLTRIKDDLTGQVAGVLAVYHIGPATRSLGRIREHARLGQRILPTEASLYLVVHLICGLNLALCFWQCRAIRSV